MVARRWSAACLGVALALGKPWLSALLLNRREVQNEAWLTGGGDGEPVRKLGLLFTNDMHSATATYPTLTGMIRAERTRMEAAGRKVLTMDAGDWFSGSMFDQLGFSSQSTSTPELEYFNDAGYDAVLFGNHAFDSNESALATMMKKATSNGLNLLFLSTNLVTDPDSPLNEFKSDADIVNLTYGERPNGVKVAKGAIFRPPSGENGPSVGVIGIEGPDDCVCSLANRPTARFVGFDDSTSKIDMRALANMIIEYAQRLRALGANEIVLLIHSGAPEDNELGQLLGDHVDALVGGHTHEIRFAYLAPHYNANKALPMVQCGSDGSHLGSLELDFSGTAGKLSLWSERLVQETGHACLEREPSNSKTDDQNVHTKLKHWKREVRDVLNLGDVDEVVFRQERGPMSYFKDSDGMMDAARRIADASLAALNQWLADHRPKEHRVDLFITCPECIRQPVVSGADGWFQLSLGQVYELVSISGSEPFSSFFMRKQDVALIVEAVWILEKTLSERFALAVSTNLAFDVFPWGVPFLNRVTNMRFNGKDYNEWPDLIRVAMPKFVAPYFFGLQRHELGIGSRSSTEPGRGADRRRRKSERSR